jgi:hypothetical protein
VNRRRTETPLLAAQLPTSGQKDAGTVDDALKSWNETGLILA